VYYIRLDAWVRRFSVGLATGVIIKIKVVSMALTLISFNFYTFLNLLKIIQGRKNNGRNVSQ